MKKHPITRLMLSVTSLVLIIASMMCMTVACSQNGDGENSSSATTASTVSTVDPDAGNMMTQAISRTRCPRWRTSA